MRRHRLLIPILLVGIAVVATACGGGGETPVVPNEQESAQETPSPPEQQTANEGETVMVDTIDFAFVEQEVTVKPGTTVTWTNSDTVAHTVTSDDGKFDSGTMNQGDTWSYTFEEVGEYPYYCIPHPFMTGTVIVKE